MSAASAATSAAIATTFTSHVKTFCDKPYMSGTEKVYPGSKVDGAKMGPIWGQQDPGGPYVGPMNLVMWVGGNVMDDHSMTVTQGHGCGID